VIRKFAAAPLILLAPGLLGAANQSQDQAPAPPQTQSTPPNAPAAALPKAPKPRPKKVWTDENLGEAGGTISVVGDPQAASKGQTVQRPQAKPTPGKSPGETVDPRTLAAVRQQLQRLQINLDQIDQQLAQLKGFSKGDAKNAGGIQRDTSQYNSSSVEEQLRHLQEKKANLQTAIDNLLDAARKSGIEPGQMR
jgi:hypothetical protein